MRKKFIIMIAIYIALLAFIIISILDKPAFGDDAFSLSILSWMFYTTAKHETDLQKLKDEVRELKSGRDDK